MSTRSIICKSCGDRIDPYEEFCIRPRYGPPRYCSMKCRLIGQAWISFILAILFFLAVCIGLLALYVNPVSNYSDAKGFFIPVGCFTIFFAFYSAIGFRLRRTADRR